MKEKVIKFKESPINLPSVGDLVKCSGCGRRILVERGLIGVSHTISITVTCWQCLDSKTKERAKKRYHLEEEEYSRI